MKGLRIFDKFGFDLPKDEAKPVYTPTITKIYDEWNFDLKSHDWLNKVNEDGLTDYRPHIDLIELLADRIDTALE